jgi:hypothetical protein
LAVSKLIEVREARRAAPPPPLVLFKVAISAKIGAPLFE